MIFSLSVDNFWIYKERKKESYSEMFLERHKSLDFGRVLISPNKKSED
jgi:hypothetical protein